MNSGCSNVAMGARGIGAMRRRWRPPRRARSAARAREMLVASTGVIGMPLPMDEDPARRSPRASQALAADGMPAAARAIMTTDTVPKQRRRARCGSTARVTIAGIAKGSGMIEPNMATMLAFLADRRRGRRRRSCALRCARAADAQLQPAHDRRRELDERHRAAARERRAPATPRSRGARAAAPTRSRRRSRRSASRPRARARARRRGRDEARDRARRAARARTAQATRAAKRIANSLLVKTALFGGDPNWGRVLQTIGAGRIDLDLAKAEVKLGGRHRVQERALGGPEARARAPAKP